MGCDLHFWSVSAIWQCRNDAKWDSHEKITSNRTANVGNACGLVWQKHRIPIVVILFPNTNKNHKLRSLISVWLAGISVYCSTTMIFPHGLLVSHFVLPMVTRPGDAKGRASRTKKQPWRHAAARLGCWEMRCQLTFLVVATNGKIGFLYSFISYVAHVWSHWRAHDVWGIGWWAPLPGSK